MAEVGRVDRELGGDHDLVLVGRRLGVVALERRLALGAHDARVVIGRVDPLLRALGRGVGGEARRAPEPAPVAAPAARPPGGKGRVGVEPDPVRLLEPAL
jgi:hypothetical protein